MMMDVDELVRSTHFIKKSIDTLRLSYFFYIKYFLQLSQLLHRRQLKVSNFNLNSLCKTKINIAVSIFIGATWKRLIFDF